MEDRREWAVARAREIAGSFEGKPAPKVVISENPYGAPVSVDGYDLDLEKPAKLPEPELRISATALEELSERELIYHITHALIRHHNDPSTFAATAIPLLLLPSAITFIGVVSLARAHGPLWYLALPAVLLVIPLGIPLILPLIDADLKRTHLQAIEMTGDAETGIAFLRHQGHKRLPAFLRRFIPPPNTRLCRAIEREAKARGFTKPLSDG